MYRCAICDELFSRDQGLFERDDFYCDECVHDEEVEEEEEEDEVG